MTDFFARLDRLADAAASRIAAWTLRYADADRREWVLALQAELSVLETGWQRLGWAAGGITLVLHRRVRVRAPHSPAVARAIPMDVDSGHDFGGWLTPLGRNLLAILLAYPLVIGFVYVSRNLDGRYWREAMAIAFVVGSIPAIALGARPVAYGLLGQGVFGLVEFAFHLVAGIDKVQGGQAHWTVMIAGTLAVVCGATIERGRRTAVIGVIWNPKDLVGSAVRVGTLLRRRTGLLAHGAAALFSFGLSEAAVHLVFGLHPFRDNVTHAAILAAAILGAAMGGLSESFGMRPSVPRRTAAGA